MTPDRPSPLSPDLLVRRCDLSALKFTTTADLPEIDLMAAQKRALSAIQFGVDIDAAGFNLFVIGTSREGMDEAVKGLLHKKAGTEPLPPDWLYLNNFAAPHRPVAVELPAGQALRFRDAMRELVEDLKVAIPAAFESDDHQARRSAIEQSFSEKHEQALKTLHDEAEAASLAILRTPFGFALAPIKDGQVIRPEVFNALPEAERLKLQRSIQDLEKKLESVLRSVPRWVKERRQELRLLNQETTQNAVGHLIDEIKGRFTGLPRILDHLEEVRKDLVENVGLFIAPQVGGQQEDGTAPVVVAPFDRYEVNVLVSQDGQHGAPVIEELHPTLANLVGRIEHIFRQGVLQTDFRLVKPGALHRANGGYLLLDARSLLTEPFSWTALKRALKGRQIRIESAIDLLSLTTTISLEPDPIPLDAKIVLFGDRLLYYLLSALDPELREHFKVLADFDDALDRKDGAEAVYARLIASMAKERGSLPLDRNAVARVIERAARLSGDAAKLTLLVEHIRELITEADYLARKNGNRAIGELDVEGAIKAQIERASRVRDQMQESILRDIALIDTSGLKVGQVNGLSYIELGGFGFGRPSRITARVSPGSGKVIDIEREVALGGPIHSKGVLILSGYISGRYALDAPISLLASLVFEQSYSGVEGDSASLAELYALLSALADVPLRQDLAVTGSVNQHGEVQAIGGVNEKIEGYFDICNARGLTGTQGVLVPAGNVQHLMLRRDVADACAAGRFSIFSVATIDEGVALLGNLPAGQRGEDGTFPPGTFNRLVEERLKRFAQARRSLAYQEKD
jgi:lon-related putative ATP-dependent protease